MSEHKHENKSKPQITPQSEQVEDQFPSIEPSEALSRLLEGTAKKTDILELQRTIGNRAVANIIRRHSIEDFEMAISNIDEDPHLGFLNVGYTTGSTPD
jgi:hypothetical protein